MLNRYMSDRQPSHPMRRLAGEGSSPAIAPLPLFGLLVGGLWHILQYPPLRHSDFRVNFNFI